MEANFEQQLNAISSLLGDLIRDVYAEIETLERQIQQVEDRIPAQKRRA